VGVEFEDAPIYLLLLPRKFSFILALTVAIAGISIGAILGVLLIALVAFLLGRRQSTQPFSNHPSAAAHELEDAMTGYKAELDGQERAAVDLVGRGILHWWNRRSGQRSSARTLNESDPRELSG
jgi:hypothetical protein